MSTSANFPAYTYNLHNKACAHSESMISAMQLSLKAVGKSYAHGKEIITPVIESMNHFFTAVNA